jgi:hypothetical protein
MNIPRPFLASLIAGFVLLSPLPGNAAVILYDTPAADTYVYDGQPGNNFGTAINLVTRYTANNTAMRLTYIRFDLDGLLTETVESASLSITFQSLSNANGTSATISVYGLNHSYVPPTGKLGLDWGETELTNENAPWAASGSSTVPGIVTLLGTFEVPVTPPPSGGTVYSISTPELAAFLETYRANNEDNVTFILRSNTSTLFNFASKENPTYGPSTLSVTTVPEPNACLLSGLGLALLLRRNSRPSRE